MRTIRLLVVLPVLLLVGRHAAAQGVAGVPIPSGTAAQSGAPIFVAPPTDTLVLAPAGGAQPGLFSIELFDGARPVLDAPYSAEAVTKFTQVLADGNRIENERSVMVARDSRGRTRREHQAVFLGAVVAERPTPLVTIADPDTGTHVTLDQERRVALRAPVPRIAEIAGTPLTPDEERRVVLRARPPQAGDIRSGTSSAPTTFSYPPDGNVGYRAGVKLDWNAVETPLGERQMEGVRAVGTQTTLTIPAGQIGNLFPLEIVSERWYSPDLQVLVMSRRSDPRVGETVYHLTNISLGEPPQSLFEIPPDFRVQQVGGAPR